MGVRNWFQLGMSSNWLDSLPSLASMLDNSLIDALQNSDVRLLRQRELQQRSRKRSHDGAVGGSQKTNTAQSVAYF